MGENRFSIPYYIYKELHRQCQHKLRASALGHRSVGDVTTQTAGYVAGYGETDALSVEELVQLDVWLKDALSVGSLYSRTGIADCKGYQHLIDIDGDIQFDGTLGGELEGILQQVCQRTDSLLQIGRHHRGSCIGCDVALKPHILSLVDT